ncbi:MAG: hypothetical protein KC983_08170, partial [Phycisphaerales bacterium]|nr:hypothetical protein [Phycisphaerales bacterium]
DHEALRSIARMLDHQRRHNAGRLDRLIHDRAVPRKWPIDLAGTYLKDRLVFDWTPDRAEAMEYFWSRAHAHGLLDRIRPLRTLDIR